MRAPSSAISMSRGWRFLLAALCLASICAIAWAQSDDAGQGDAGDPPTRVARLSYASGDLGLLPAGSTQWSAASVNRPLTNGDKLSSGPGARAELELDGAVLRINEHSDIGVLNLNGQIGQFELTQGTLNLNVRILPEGATYEVDTPTLALVMNQPGTVRVDIGPNGAYTTVSLFAGSAVVYGEHHAQRDIFSGRSYQFADATLNNVVVSDIGGGDAFDTWCADRDAQYGSNIASTQYVSEQMVGAQDLDQYGTWQDDSDYGAVWYPSDVAVGWSPYSFGYWTWIGPWGWTWVDNLPWGFAPYHYGRWAYLGHRWGWIPGPRYRRPIYAPALVAFAGIGHGGPVGWVPLGPHEVYNPWYRASRNYYTQINTSNIALGRSYSQGALTDSIRSQYASYQTGRPAMGVTYVNRSAPNGFTAVSAQAFASARNVQHNRVAMSPQQIAAATPIAAGALQRPTPASFAQARLVDARPLPAAGFNRQVVAVGRPAPSIQASTSVRAGQPASNVRVLSGVAAPAANTRAPEQARFAQPAAPMQAPVTPHPATLPQLPRLESAQQIQQAPRFPSQPSPQLIEQQQAQRQLLEQQRQEQAERSHQYVPEQRQMAPDPSYQPYRSVPMPQPYARPEYEHSLSQPHPQQSTSKPHASAPPAHGGNSNQH
ncbi:MAG TPA: DUF6600 domain-containing protein [Dyella sp.]|uniref:DUF6600 domain-containing protein n=1 Tax=Dyella sp. TaxID=1869338 RepID=UPI002C36D468|nr:DUF6600 domain-containing protein [Dyella sp.]HTV87251.1 DUF6600 domain-containing protein [Dyella sp.]